MRGRFMPKVTRGANLELLELMEIPKAQVKIFARGLLDVASYMAVFQRWIREHTLDELLIDVVDYSHVVDGPDIAVIGHESDYVLDRSGGRLGLVAASKRASHPPGKALFGTLKRALRACLLLGKEPLVKAPLEFGSDEMLLRVADRLNAPNTRETFERLAPALRETFSAVYGATPFTLTQVGSPRELFSVEVHAPDAPALEELLIGAERALRSQ